MNKIIPWVVGGMAVVVFAIFLAFYTTQPDPNVDQIVVRFKNSLSESEARDILVREGVEVKNVVYRLPEWRTCEGSACGVDFGFVNEAQTYQLSDADVQKFKRMLKGEEHYQNVCDDQCWPKFGFSNEDVLDPPDFEQLFRKVSALSYLEFGYSPRHDQQSVWKRGSSIEWKDVYTKAIHAKAGMLIFQVRFTQPNVAEFQRDLTRDAPEWTVLPRELLDPENYGDFVYSSKPADLDVPPGYPIQPNSAYITIGRKDEIEQARRIATEERVVVQSIGIPRSEPVWTYFPYRHQTIFKIRFKKQTDMNPISYIEHKYNLLKAYPFPRTAEPNGSDLEDPESLIVYDVTGVIAKESKTAVVARLRTYDQVLSAHEVWKDKLPVGVAETRGIWHDGGMVLAEGELLVNFIDDNMAEEQVRYVAEKTGGKIIGQIEGLSSYQLYYAEPKNADDLNKISAMIESMPGVEAVSPNYMAGPL